MGRRVYERGFWKAKGSGRGSGAMAQPKIGERFSSEMDVLLANFDSAVDTNEGVVDEIDGTDLTDGPVAVNQRRWRRVAWAAGVLVKHVEGLELVNGKVIIRGVLADKLAEVEAERLAQLDLADVPPPRQVREEEIELESETEDEDPDLAVLRVCSSLLIETKLMNRNDADISAHSSMFLPPRPRSPRILKNTTYKLSQATRCWYSIQTFSCPLYHYSRNW